MRRAKDGRLVPLSDENEKPEVASTDGAKKKGGSKALTIVLGVLAIAAFVGGVAAGPTIAVKLHIPGYIKVLKPEKEEEPPAAMSAPIDGMIVDLKDKDGVSHHLKVGFAVELSKVVPEDEFKKIQPRIKYAALVYMRNLGFETVTDPQRFEEIRKELEVRVEDAVGKSRFKRVLFTEFVAQ